MSSRGKRILGLSQLLHLATPERHSKGFDKQPVLERCACSYSHRFFGF